MKVLITSSKHFASFQLAFLLKNDEVIFGDHYADFPPAESNSIAHQILKFCLDHQIEQVFPLAFAEVEELRKSTILFEEFGIELMISEKDLTTTHKQVNSFAELSSGLIALGYPNKKIAIADSAGRGELILIDDAVTVNLQIWNGVKSMSFNQLGKWFNQTSFSAIALYQLNGELQQFFVLINNAGVSSLGVLPIDIYENVKNMAQQQNLKGFCSVSIADQTVLRIINTTF
ncbi:MAG TPA: hypothetical protein VFM79_00465 [Pelobium sp.]|nr:hypothetical protein [Pelobium sp.]